MQTSKIIRIGTRDSDLALWQAKTVQKKLEKLGFQTEIVAVKSTGDLVLDKPLYELGITGIFTKTLDVAMLNNQIDIAVHSMKDVPTALPKGIVQSAVLERANNKDVLVHKGNLDFLQGESILATGSLRRKAQWLHKYPNHKLEDLRGNVNTRLQKLSDSNWSGAIFAAAGLERLGFLDNNNELISPTFSGFVEVLDWMVPAPAQGAMVVVAKENDIFCKNALSQLNHQSTEICTHIERQFLKTLEGGCTAPIGALATIIDDHIHFQGVLFSLDGKEKYEILKNIEVKNHKNFGATCANELLQTAAVKEIMQSFKKNI